MSPTVGTIGNVIVSGTSIALYVDDASDPVGYTRDGVSVEPAVDHYDIEADQSINILGKRRIKETFRVIANILESTLENIKIAMGEENSISDDGSYKRLSFGGGTTVTEHTLRFEGKAPGSDKARKVWIYKAVSVDVGGMSYKKGEDTLIPITFEAIADTSKPEGEQLGYYEDEQ